MALSKTAIIGFGGKAVWGTWMYDMGCSLLAVLQLLVGAMSSFIFSWCYVRRLRAIG